jgi:hypothetical protein
MRHFHAGVPILALAVGIAPAFAQAPLHSLASPGEQAGGHFGNAVAGVPDVDGDGVPDLVIGAVSEASGTAGVAGRAYVFSGASGGLIRVHQSPNEEDGGQFGIVVSGVPDVDGDGRGDVLIGARFESPGSSPVRAGRSYLFSGATGALLREFVSPNQAADGFFGIVAGLPDVDGDGRGDILIGAANEGPPPSPAGAGRAYLFSGSTGALLHTLASPNEEAGGLFGHTVAAVPDADGDGLTDLLVGADFEDPGTSPNDAGRAYLFSSVSGALLHQLQSPNEEAGGFFGGALAGVPDVDGDGRGDVIVGADFEDPDSSPTDAGRAYVFSGTTGALLHTLASPAEEETSRFGFGVAGLGDLDGDGRGDILVGVPFEDPGTGPLDAGRAYLFSGAAGLLRGTLASPAEMADGRFGESVAGLGDVDGDGVADVVVGAIHEYAGASPPQAGRVYVYSGGAVGSDTEEPAPRAFLLSGPFPNPSRDEFTLRLELATPGDIRLAISDALGREVALIFEGTLPSGRHNLMVDARGLAPGVYSVQATGEGSSASRAVTVLR